jgi:hypothetical protein
VTGGFIQQTNYVGSNSPLFAIPTQPFYTQPSQQAANQQFIGWTISSSSSSSAGFKGRLNI